MQFVAFGADLEGISRARRLSGRRARKQERLRARALGHGGSGVKVLLGVASRPS